MKNHLRVVLLLAGLLALIDQFSKYLIVRFLVSDLPIFGKFFTLHYTENPGIAFGINLPIWLLTFGGITLLCVLTYLASKEFDLTHPFAKISLALIIGGGLGNLIDRFARGFVVDFISVWQWPVFNVADIFVTVGVLLIVLFYGRIKHVSASKASANN